MLFFGGPVLGRDIAAGATIALKAAVNVKNRHAVNAAKMGFAVFALPGKFKVLKGKVAFKTAHQHAPAFMVAGRQAQGIKPLSLRGAMQFLD